MMDNYNNENNDYNRKLENMEPAEVRPVESETASASQTGNADSTQTRQQSASQSSAHTTGSDRKKFYHTGLNEGKPKKDHKKNPFLKSLGCGVIVGVVAGALVIGSFAIGKNSFGTSAASAGNSTASLTTTQNALADSGAKATTTSASSEGTYSVSDIAANCTSCVVAITNKGITETMTMFGTYSQESESAGSGVIISKSDTELLIATNYHVIEGSEELSVCFNDSKDAVYEASVKGTDEENDLAVIAVKLSDMDKDVLNSVTVATIGDSDALAIGDQVVAIGNALGSGQSVTSGVVSAKDREVTIDNTTTKLLQTDAAINPGNSGGALFNMNGELVGINSAKYSETSVEGMGFAIPMSTAQSIIQDLMNEESREKLDSGYGYLGIYGGDVDSTTASNYGIPSGVYVSEVIEDGPAEAAGLQKGDIITKLDGKSVSSMSSMKEKLQYYKAGETIEVTYQRSDNGTYQEGTAKVTLGSSDDAEADSNAQNGQNGQSDQNNNNSGNQTNPFSGGNGNSGSNGSNGFSFEW